MTKPRLLFIDILKTVGVISVLYWHLFYRDQYLGVDIPFYGLMRLGGFGVLLFLFASGLSLSIKDYNLSTKKEILDFYYKRLIRVYPAMWLAILITLVLMPTYLNNLDTLKLAEEFTGFYYYFQAIFLILTPLCGISD
jgi:peptidoglycan/LPS O-acetylase OafA/YrhL